MKQMGYLMIDHRFSPGLSEDVARQAGYDPNLVGEGKFMEVDTMTCSHCKCAVVPNPFRVRPRENCPKCGNHYICDMCALATRDPDYSHMPFDKKVDEHIAAAIKYGTVMMGSPRKLLMREDQ